MKTGKPAVIVIHILLFFWFSLFLAEKIDLTTADLGRHIKNGEIILSSFFQNSGKGDIFSKNFYSYTNPDFSFINHHWASGVVFYLIYKAGGFEALSFFYILVYVLAFGIFFFMAKNEAGSLPAVALSMLMIPLMASRTEIRPEVFSYLFSGIFFYICLCSRKGKISPNWLYLFIPLSFLWVNLHIAFFFGFLIIGIFLAEGFLTSHYSKKLMFSFVISLFVVLLNPNGLAGALEPLNIFKNYGYLVFENQSIGFLKKLGHASRLNFWLFKFSFIILVISFIGVFIKQRTLPLPNFFLAFVFAFMAYRGIRNFPFFGFFALPVISENIKIFSSNFSGEKIKQLKKIISTSAIIFIAIGFLQGFVYFYRQKDIAGLGIREGANDSANFFKENNIQGPVFNNYDIGGYLIYHLYPEHKVFVDNRPEAYPASFFESAYIPAQENEEKWLQLEKQYDFNAIFFSWRDYTPWAQNFLIQRINDKSFVPVFADDYNIIFVKRTDQNKNIIEKYELLKEMFKVNKKPES